MVLGIDIGANYTKGVLISSGRIAGKAIVKTAFQPKRAIATIKEILTGYEKIVATGYGRELVTDADLTVTEITAFARGAYFLNPEVKTIIDIGGQDSKVIKVKGGKPERFVMNDRCAAGTGNFIEKIAQALNLSLKEFGNLAVASHQPALIDSLCVVMAETEILSLVAEGRRIEDITAGVCNAVMRRILGITGTIEVEPPILFAGGGALNPGLVKAAKQIFGEIIVPESPQFLGALGAALIGEKKHQ
uniref:ATPase BadF/BadG/BcrA/BcrD type domain-containing protein n=1 Tax=candidate division WOR-3 bacterium TaxID=2052148 RepID=A0A7C3YT53_UNCW3